MKTLFTFFIIFISGLSLFGGVRTFGPLKLGEEIPFGQGAYAHAPPSEIPPSRFYINIAKNDLWCTFEECAPEGARIEKLGGWLQGEDADQPEIQELFGFEEHPTLSSIVVVADKNEKIVGIYPEKDTRDIGDIMRRHSTLIGIRR